MLKFVDDWHLWWKRWSTWLAAIFATVVATVTANPSLFVGLLALFPGNARIGLAAILFTACLIVPVLTVHLRQGKLEGRRNGK